MTILERVQTALPALSPAEKRVGRLCLKDPQSFTKLPVSTLAHLSHVSNPTVVRFCRSVGYGGLADFKHTLADNVNEGVPFIHHSVHCNDKPFDVLGKVIDNTIAGFQKYRDEVNIANIDLAIDALMLAYEGNRRVQFFGVGNSGVVAQDAQLKFFRLGMHATAYVDGHMQLMSASILGPGDCIVVFSNSGRTRDLIDACGIARSCGATTIAVTATESSLAKASSIHLSADHTERFDMYSPMVSRLLHLIIVDAMATCLALRIGTEKLQPTLSIMQDNLRTKRCA